MNRIFGIQIPILLILSKNYFAYCRRYFTATLKSFGHGAVMVTVSLVTG